MRNILGVVTPGIIGEGVFSKEYIAGLSSVYMIFYSLGNMIFISVTSFSPRNLNNIRHINGAIDLKSDITENIIDSLHKRSAQH